MQKRTSITLLAVSHACVDVYQGTVAALVPLFVAERAYTYAAASGVVLAASLLSSVAQPAFGAVTDRRAMPWLLPVSTLLGGVGMALAGVSEDYTLTLLFVALSGIGVAAYHPESARIARAVSGGSHTAMACFSAGGNVGFAMAPLVVAAVTASGGLARTPLLVVPALAGAAVAVPVIHALAGRQGTDGIQSGRSGRSGRDDTASFARLALAVVFRSVAFIGLSTFIALHAREQMGGGVAAGTAALFVLYLGGVAGSLLGGAAADRWGRVTVCRWSYGVSALAIAGVALVPGPALYVFVALTSAGLYVPFSLQLTLAQDYLPNRIGTASGVTLGLTVSIGGLTTPLLGRIADATSVQVALVPLVAMPVLSWLMFSTLQDPVQPAPRQSAPVAPGPHESARAD